MRRIDASNLGIKTSLHVPSLSPCPCPSRSKCSITPMVIVPLTGRMGSVPILSVKQSVSIGTMINFDSDGDGHGDRDGTCKQALKRTTKFHDKEGQGYNSFCADSSVVSNINSFFAQS